MQTGELTVTGKNHTSILLAGKPREVFVHFKRTHNREDERFGEHDDEDDDDRHHVPCNPHHKDHLEYEVVSEDEPLVEHSKMVHHHHDRRYYLLIKWRVEGVGEIDWIVIY